MATYSKESTSPRLRELATLAVGILFGLTLMTASSFGMGLQFRMFRILIVLVLPGMIGSMAIGQNVHAFSIAIAAVVNGAFYAGLTWLAFFIRAKTRQSPQP